MAEEASAHDAFAQALSGGEAHAAEPTHEVQQDVAPQIAQDAPQGGSGPEGGTHLQSGQEAPQSPQERAQEAMVPSWRLREINEQREAERRQWQQEQRELAELKRWKEEQERQRQEAERQKELDGQDFWTQADPNKYIDQRFDHRFQAGMKQAMDPFQQQIAEMFQQQQQAAIHNSRLVAHQVFGEDKVKAAEEAFNRAAASGSIERDEHARIINSPNQFEAAVRWHQRQSTLEAIGGDLDSYNKRQQDELLKNPEFLARALEAHRQMATPVQTGVPGRGAPSQPQRTLPSLNRQTSSRDASGEGDVGDVFAQTIAERGRRAG